LIISIGGFGLKRLVDWTQLISRFHAHRTQLRFCVRMTFVGLFAFAIAQLLRIPLHGLWVVLTAVVVTQMSAGGSLRATVEYMIGTLSGVVYAGAIGLLIPQTTGFKRFRPIVVANGAMRRLINAEIAKIP
jgi:uncharacterized membrane protein YccC